MLHPCSYITLQLYKQVLQPNSFTPTKLLTLGSPICQHLPHIPLNPSMYISTVYAKKRNGDNWLIGDHRQISLASVGKEVVGEDSKGQDVFPLGKTGTDRRVGMLLWIWFLNMIEFFQWGNKKFMQPPWRWCTWTSVRLLTKVSQDTRAHMF